MIVYFLNDELSMLLEK